eukprot:g3886.t1
MKNDIVLTLEQYSDIVDLCGYSQVSSSLSYPSLSTNSDKTASLQESCFEGESHNRQPHAEQSNSNATQRSATIRQPHKPNLQDAIRLKIPLDTLRNIYGQQYQYHIRRTTRIHRQPSRIAHYDHLYTVQGKSIREIASLPEVNYSPYQLARIMVEHKMGLRDKNGHQNNAKRLVDTAKNGRNQTSKRKRSTRSKELSRYMKQADKLIPDPRLRREIAECREYDLQSSPYSDAYRLSKGNEYERILQQTLRRLGIVFETEDDARKRGISKTPDILLQIPVLYSTSPQSMGDNRNSSQKDNAIQLNHGESEQIKSTAIYWIDSKAMFGDPSIFQHEHKSQLQSYVNRFGPGLVIYWFGYVDVLDTASRDIVIDTNFRADSVLLL